MTLRSLYSLATEIAWRVEIEPRQDVHRRRHVVLRHLAGRDQVRHRRQDVRAVDAVVLGAEHDVVAGCAPRGLLRHVDVGHAVLGEQALLLGDDQRRRHPSARCSRGPPCSPQVRRPARMHRPESWCGSQPSSAAVPALVFRNPRRLTPCSVRLFACTFVVIDVVILVVGFRPPEKQKRRDRWTPVRSLDSGGVAYQARPWTLVTSLYKRRANRTISRKACDNQSVELMLKICSIQILLIS